MLVQSKTYSSTAEEVHVIPQPPHPRCRPKTHRQTSWGPRSTPKDIVHFILTLESQVPFLVLQYGGKSRFISLTLKRLQKDIHITVVGGGVGGSLARGKKLFYTVLVTR